MFSISWKMTFAFTIQDGIGISFISSSDVLEAVEVKKTGQCGGGIGLEVVMARAQEAVGFQVVMVRVQDAVGLQVVMVSVEEEVIYRW